ncbi:diacylglycerol/lipid kinase family protein [Pseudonocardia humida]|uniref:Diacylglycerol kinase family lipid kinase n=1 Tax=Pseudonocardia humida TaxID=2800819 RepID=A0ABT0ZSJ2_9PSEU|nr:diacylglycerol kinase family protein [Pseudonocardia humida]MCO1653696.1 diacylglycerol kinase family lipid kinase [Pseudonocardia humida]
MEPVTAVVNPAAGRGAALVVARRLVEALPAGGVEVAQTRDPAHAREIAEQACAQGRTVLAVGGDGLAGCVAGPVVAAGGVLAMAPAGRGNDFARQLGLPTDPAAVAEVLLTGRIRHVDVLESGGRVVLGSVYAGVDSAANAIANARPGVPGALVYPYSAVRALLTFRPAGFRLGVDGEEWSARGYSVVVANSGFYGAGMHIVPTAEVDDGLLDVLVIPDSSRWTLIASMREVYSGTHLRRPDVRVRRGREVELSIDRPLPVYADGEPFADAPLRVRVRPGALRVLVPRGG